MGIRFPGFVPHTLPGKACNPIIAYLSTMHPLPHFPVILAGLAALLAGPVPGFAQPPKSGWLSALRDTTQRLESHYTANAVRVFNNGTTAEGPEAIALWWREQRPNVDSIVVYTHIEPRNPAYVYEISALFLSEGRVWKQLVIWNLDGPQPKRELEFVASAFPLQQYRADLHRRREAWMHYCNSHQVDDLVEELYVADALYYNHRPMIRGRKALEDTYRYMRNPAYRLELKPEWLEPVNELLAFEIGQCEGSYGGKYILIWQKDTDGKWRILLDSNI